MATVYNFPHKKLFTPQELERLRTDLAAQGLDEELSTKVIEELRAVIGQTYSADEPKTMQIYVPAEFGALPGSSSIIQDIFDRAIWLATRRLEPVISAFGVMTVRALVAENELENKN